MKKSKKLNSKKGFTLVEMLVVIAIIAILVSIMVPTVLGATTKAKAATDAANLRTELSMFMIEYISGGSDTDTYGYTKLSGTGNETWEKTNATASKTFPSCTTMQIVFNGSTATAYYVNGSDTYSVDYFSKIADGTNS